MVPSLLLLSCESSVSVKENPDRKRKKMYFNCYVKIPKKLKNLEILKSPCLNFNRCLRIGWSKKPTFSARILNKSLEYNRASTARILQFMSYLRKIEKRCKDIYALHPATPPPSPAPRSPYNTVKAIIVTFSLKNLSHKNA